MQLRRPDERTLAQRERAAREALSDAGRRWAADLNDGFGRAEIAAVWREEVQRGRRVRA